MRVPLFSTVISRTLLPILLLVCLQDWFFVHESRGNPEDERDLISNTDGIFANGLSVDQMGNLYIADTFNHRVLKRDATTGRLIRIAGNGRRGFSGDGGPATAASLKSPTGIAVDQRGNLYIADRFNNRIRRVDATTGVITTLAGDGTWGFRGDGGPATKASFRGPYGVSVDQGENLYIADTNNARVRRIEAATGIVKTIAGNGKYDLSGDGGPAEKASLRNPYGIALDRAGNLFIVDRFNNRIRRVDALTGVISTIAGKGGPVEFSGDGGPAQAAGLGIPSVVALDEEGNLYIADTKNQRVRRVDARTGIITTVAGNGIDFFSGDGGPAEKASLRDPSGVAIDEKGNLYISDQGNGRIRHVQIATRIITTAAGSTPP